MSGSQEADAVLSPSSQVADRGRRFLVWASSETGFVGWGWGVGKRGAGDARLITVPVINLED